MRARVRQVLRRRHQEIQGDDAGVQPSSVRALADFYEEHNDRLEEARRGMRTDDLIYPQMKVLDMGFWQVGFEKN